MNKLIVYGRQKLGKLLSERVIFCTIYCNNDHRVVVEAPTPEISKEIEREIERYAYEEGFLLAPTPHGPGIRQKAGDPRFLEALRCDAWLWLKSTYGPRDWLISAQDSTITS